MLSLGFSLNSAKCTQHENNYWGDMLRVVGGGSCDVLGRSSCLPLPLCITLLYINV